MRDVEIFIRYCSFVSRIEEYRGNLKSFLDDTCKIFNKRWDQYEERIKTLGENFNSSFKITFDIFGKNAFKKWTGEKFEPKYNKAVIDIMTYYFSVPDIARESLKNKTAVCEAFKHLCKSNAEFLASLEKTTKSLSSTRDRFSLWGEMLQSVTGSSVAIPKIYQK